MSLFNRINIIPFLAVLVIHAIGYQVIATLFKA